MPIDSKYVGKKYGPTTYTCGVEKMREFAYAIGGGVPSAGFGGGAPDGLSPLLWDSAVAKDGPYKDVIAFPSFAVTFSIAPFFAAVTDPELGINLVMLVHGEQEFEWFDVLKPNDVISCVGEIKQIYDKAGKDFVIVETLAKNQHGKLVVRGLWTAVIRHG